MAVAPEKTPIGVMSDFLGSAPSLEEIAEYQVPEFLNERLHWLLDKNAGESLSTEERSELDDFLLADHIMTLTKAKALLNLQQKQS